MKEKKEKLIYMVEDYKGFWLFLIDENERHILLSDKPYKKEVADKISKTLKKIYK